MKTELVALKGRLYTKSFQLADGQQVVIGRGEDADIQILDAGLSRRHCAIEKSGETFRLTDLGSRNGTLINGRRIDSTELQQGDQVQIGGIEFEFRRGPDRRRVNADLIAAIPEKSGGTVKTTLNVDASDLMELSQPLQSMENYRRIQRDLAAIYKIGNLISAESDIENLYTRILDALLQVVGADRSFLILADKNGDLHPVAHKERPDRSAEIGDHGFSKTIVEECYRDHTSILRSNALQDERYKRAESVIALNIHSVIAVPIETPEHVLGVIYVDTVSQSEAFVKHDLELLLAIGKQAGVAIQRAQFSGQLQQMLRGTVRALAAAIEAKDDYTRGHSDRVTQFAMQIGRAIGLPEARLRMLELAGFLHDVGKIGIPENLLRKAGPLTKEEYEIVKQHARLGGDIIQNIAGADEIAEAVLHHHERWDGRGYPDAVPAEKTSILARILTVADAYDAMSSQRPYRDRLAQEHVVRTLREGAGAQFDPAVVEVFLGVLGEAEAAAPNPGAAPVNAPGDWPTTTVRKL